MFSPIVNFDVAIHPGAFMAPHALNSRRPAIGAIARYHPMPVRHPAHSGGSPRLLSIDKYCLVHDGARLAAGVAEATHDSRALLAPYTPTPPLSLTGGGVCLQHVRGARAF